MDSGATSAAPNQTLILVAAILGTAVVTIDSTVVNVALPAIEEDLGGGLAGQQWTSNAYLVTLGSLLLIGGSLGDIFGERRVFALGVLAFGVTSLACALAPTIELLVAARALQGVCRRAAHAGGARGDRGELRARRARHGRGRVDRLGRGRDGARPADRRPAGGHRVLALDLRHQRADRCSSRSSDPPRGAGRPRTRPADARVDVWGRCCAPSGSPA